MDIKKALIKRHVVKKYTDKVIPENIVKLLNDRINEINKSFGLDIFLVTKNADGLSTIAKWFLSKGANNYFVLASKKNSDLDEKLRYFGADLMIYSQMLGLNTWWIGSTFNSKNILKYKKNDDITIRGIIVVGYGESQGISHEIKKNRKIETYEGIMPEWFEKGIDFLRYAPTAYNKQDFIVIEKDNKVHLESKSKEFCKIETGIGKYHFEIGAGKENFEWF